MLFRSALVEKSQFPRRKVCGEFLSGTSLPLLREIGVAEAYLNLAGPEVQRVGLYAGDAVLMAPMPRTANGAAGWGRALGREHLDSLLLQQVRAADVHVQQPARVTSLRRDGDRHLARIASDSGETELAAKLVIAAHGSWERSPTQANVPPHRESDLLAFKAHFTGADMPPGVMPLLAFPGGYGGLVHTDSGRVSLSCCIRRGVLRNLRARNAGASAAEVVIQHIRETTRGVANALTPANLAGAALAAGPIRPGIRARYRDGIFFVGNAAGEAHPIVAEGIGMGMQSAWLLARILSSYESPVTVTRACEGAGRTYSRQWRTAFAPRIRAASFFAHLALSPAATSTALHVLQRFPALITWGARLSGKASQLVPA